MPETGMPFGATRHQRELGTGYFDDVARVIAVGCASTTALEGSTERAQF
jgi:isocitrate/methylisocitrate lyase